jgi:hypothetical protein
MGHVYADRGSCSGSGSLSGSGSGFGFKALADRDLDSRERFAGALEAGDEFEAEEHDICSILTG